MDRALKNSHYFFLAVLVVIFVGFYRTYFSLFPHFKGITTLLHIHAALILLWMSMLIVQPILIRTGRAELHRRVGRLSYAVVPVMVLTIALVMRESFQKPLVVTPGVPNLGLIGVADLTFFGLMYGLAIYYRHKVIYHARYMVLTALPFINPAVGRLSLPGPLFALVIMVGLLVYERSQSRVYRPYLIALPAYVGIYSLFIFGITRGEWLAFWARIY